MGNNKFGIGYVLIFIGVIGLLRMIFGYTDFSFITATLFIGGIVLLIIGMYKEKSKPKYLQEG